MQSLIFEGTLQNLIFDGTVQSLIFDGTVQSLIFDGTLQRLIFDGTIQRLIFDGTIQRLIFYSTMQSLISISSKSCTNRIVGPQLILMFWCNLLFNIYILIAYQNKKLTFNWLNTLQMTFTIPRYRLGC